MGSPELLQLKTTGQHRPSADEVARADASFRSEQVKVLQALNLFFCGDPNFMLKCRVIFRDFHIFP